MKYVRIINIVLIVQSAIALRAQDTMQVVDERVDFADTSTQNWNEIKSLCNTLNIPANPKANINLLTFTLDWYGTPYCFGGNSRQCTDCSGFTSNAYQKVFAKTIPRVSRDIYASSMPIAKYSLYEGDLVFFATAGGKRITHVGIYLWDGYFAHASSSRGVTISNLRQGYYHRAFIGGGAWLD